MKYESSSDVPVLLTTLFLRRDTPWRRKMKHRIGFKEMYFQIDFTCRIPFPVKQGKKKTELIIKICN